MWVRHNGTLVECDKDLHFALHEVLSVGGYRELDLVFFTLGDPGYT